MKSGRRMNQKGIAMVTAIVLALVVSATVAVVLSLTFRRFELSAFRTDHAVAAAASEAGLQYAFARLDKDAVFKKAVDDKPASGYYLIYCHANTGFPPEYQVAPDATVAALHMGNRHVAVRIRHFPDDGTAATPLDTNPLWATRPYKVRAVAVFGTGGQ